MDQNAVNSAIFERRGKQRITCAYPAIVHGCSIDGKKLEENATVLNLSVSGIYVKLNCYIQNGQELSVKIAFPTGSLELGTSKLAIKGVVVRGEPYSEGVFGVAIKLIHYRFL